MFLPTPHLTILRRLSIACCALLSCVHPVASAQTVPQFQDGDRVAFVGDSITHGGSYHSYVYLYYLTRFPEREFRIWNKGVSGEKASHVLRRFDEDVAVVKPNVSTVMLGMNDVGRWLYGPDKTDTATQQKYLDTYYADMTKLLGEFAAIDSEVIFITPTIYDQTAELARNNEVGVNDALGKCADFVKAAAVSSGQGYVDFYDAMSAINADLQQSDPSATIVGQDRVHPSVDFGHFIMGYQFLKAQGVPQLVSKIVLDAKSGALEASENATVSDLKLAKDSVSFTALEAALPFPQTQSIAKSLELVPFEAEMNQQILSVQNLADGSYALAIDGTEVGIWNAAQLNAGVNLAVVQKTPQYQQALEVKKLNDQRHYQQSRLRNAAYVFYSSGLSESGIDLNDAPAIEAFLAEKLKDSEGKTWYNYVKQQYSDYVAITAKKPEINAHLESLHPELYEANQPVPHRFTLTKLAADAVTEADSEALSFDGIDDVREMGNPVSTGSAYTIAFSVKAPAQNWDHYLYTETSSSDWKPLFGIRGWSDGKLNIHSNDNANTTLYSLNSNQAVFDDIWHHVALVDDSGSVTLYIDGAYEASASYEQVGVSRNTTWLGARGVNGSTDCFFEAQVDDFVTYNTALDASTIAALAKGEVSAPPQHSFQLPSIFSDGMMLQRDKPARIWGLDVPGASVRVEFAGQSKTATANAKGEWEVKLDAMPASFENRSMAVTSQSSGLSAQVSNVLVGDVWICSGQSNMEFPLFKSTHGSEALQQPANDSIRFFKQRFDGAPEPLFDVVEGHWKSDTPDGRKWISAVAWNFAQNIYASEQVPVAMVAAYIGGSSAQMWTPIEDLRADAEFSYYVKGYQQYAANFETLKATYPTRKADAEAAGKPLSITEHYGWFPSATYNAMIHPIQNFTVKGVIWYQGEANTDTFQSKLYRKLFPTMIEAWRREMQAPELPFLFVQLPNFTPWRETDWALLRESQALTMEALEHTGMAVTIDIGDNGDVHPTLKKPVGERLARIALNQVYGKLVEYAAPEVEQIEVKGGALVLHFDGDLGLSEGAVPREFFVCGDDSNFVPADAVVEGRVIKVSSEQVSVPVEVRYAWSNDPQVNLFGVNGLPVAPFKSVVAAK